MGPAEDVRMLSEQLRSVGPQLTASERKVARVLQADYPKAGLASLPKLADRSHVSAPTVMRLLAKLGYASYKDFQATLLEEVHQRMSDPAHRVVSSGRRRGTQDDLDDRLERIAATLAETEHRVDRTELREVVALLSDLRRPVVTLGGFESEVCSFHLLNLLGQVRGQVRRVQWNPTGVAVELLDVTKHHVVVAFDFRRYQRTTIDYVRQAAERGAVVTLFTDKWMSPAADFSRYVLVCDSEGVGPFDSRVSAMALVEVLVAAVTVTIGTAGEERMRAVYDLLAGSTWGEGLLAPDEPGEGRGDADT